MSLKAIKRLVEADALQMEIIPNPKVRLSSSKFRRLCWKILGSCHKDPPNCCFVLTVKPISWFCFLISLGLGFPFSYLLIHYQIWNFCHPIMILSQWLSLNVCTPLVGSWWCEDTTAWNSRRGCNSGEYFLFLRSALESMYQNSLLWLVIISKLICMSLGDFSTLMHKGCPCIILHN